MRLKDDGTLDLDWREVRRPWWMKTAGRAREADLLNSILRNNPKLTREEAEAMLDLFW